VQAQQDDPHSLLARYRELIGWRRRISELRDGALTTRDVGTPQLVAWELREGHGAVLVVHNLSGSAQTVRLDAHDLQGYTGVRAHTEDATALAQSVLHLPAYGSVVLQPTAANDL